jgi:hypothetical protein
MKYYSAVADHPQVPEITISQADVDKAYGDPHAGHSPAFFIDSDWSRKFERFFQEHIVWVKSNNVLLLRFSYLYEVDLDRIQDRTRPALVDSSPCRETLDGTGANESLH